MPMPPSRRLTNTFVEIRGIDGVMCAAADVPVTVASVAQEFSLPGVTLETARLTSDKLAMKEHLERAGIPIPFYRPIHSTADLQRAVQQNNRPLIVKPVDSRGARGVLKLTGETDPDWAFEHARACSPTSRVMVEEYLEGPQISTETILVDGVASTPGFTDRNYEFLERFSPYVIENGGSLPPDSLKRIGLQSPIWSRKPRVPWAYEPVSPKGTWS